MNPELRAEFTNQLLPDKYKVFYNLRPPERPFGYSDPKLLIDEMDRRLKEFGYLLVLLEADPSTGKTSVEREVMSQFSETADIYCFEWGDVLKAAPKVGVIPRAKEFGTFTAMEYHQCSDFAQENIEKIRRSFRRLRDTKARQSNIGMFDFPAITGIDLRALGLKVDEYQDLAKRLKLPVKRGFVGYNRGNRTITNLVADHPDEFMVIALCASEQHKSRVYHFRLEIELGLSKNNVNRLKKAFGEHNLKPLYPEAWIKSAQELIGSTAGSIALNIIRHQNNQLLLFGDKSGILPLPGTDHKIEETSDLNESNELRSQAIENLTRLTLINHGVSKENAGFFVNLHLTANETIEQLPVNKYKIAVLEAENLRSGGLVVVPIEQSGYSLIM